MVLKLILIELSLEATFAFSMSLIIVTMNDSPSKISPDNYLESLMSIFTNECTVYL